ncbi:hypothetical protein DNL40_08600 [Xylanimonas oleitrophica]|uniref:Uncharacterized protein n=1 Tax=Xylanimonas oleitrophica TaxID=2607479 RepID=A0A2W5Y5X4_9MICO|nr:hypothetical protein [Xylanimonas oleitrophica]PZR53544.1 hypothetical protein DNL40_08600 [Xylanimonas oleitrophica]
MSTPEQPQAGTTTEPTADATPAAPPAAEVTDEAATAPEASREAEVAAVVDPGTVRRAPRYKAFFWIGALLGVAIGLGLGLYLVFTHDPSQGVPLFKPGVYVTVVVLATTTVTTLLAGLVAVLLDRRSVKGR